MEVTGPSSSSLREVRIRTRLSGFSFCPGLATPVPGLALVRLGDEPANLSLTHVPSGLAIAVWPPDGVEAMAQYVTEALHPLDCDWTGTRSEIVAYLVAHSPNGLPDPVLWGAFPSAASVDCRTSMDDDLTGCEFDALRGEPERCGDWWAPDEDSREWWVGLSEPPDPLADCGELHEFQRVPMDSTRPII